MVSYNPYAEYKPSGVDWLGDVPMQWLVSKLGFRVTTIVPMRDKPKELSGKIPWIRIEDFNGKYISESKSGQGVSRETIADMHLKVFPAGTVLCSCSCNMGRTAIVSSPVISNQTFIGLFPQFDLVSDYLYYLMQAAAEELTSLGTGAIQQYLSQDDFKALRLAFPSVEEQRAIAIFLDRETGKIDQMIEKQERMIELLKEKRQAVISHAVTKGLNLNAPMKDSGIEWLGEIPAHWGVFDLNFALNSIGDIDHYMPESIDKGVPYVMTGDLEELASSIDFDSCKQVSHIDYLKLSGRIKNSKGDVIMARYATIGTSSYIDVDREFLVSYSCVTIKPCPSKVSGLHLFYYFKSQAFLQGLQRQANTNTQGNVGVSDLKKVKVVLPDLAEQSKITEHIALETSKIDHLIAKAEQAIELMKERRTALISAAVTGKIDVRSETGNVRREYTESEETALLAAEEQAEYQTGNE